MKINCSNIIRAIFNVKLKHTFSVHVACASGISWTDKIEAVDAFHAVRKTISKGFDKRRAKMFKIIFDISKDVTEFQKYGIEISCKKL